jgi:cytoskeletal protein CcmA (bactofilin family)
MVHATMLPLRKRKDLPAPPAQVPSVVGRSLIIHGTLESLGEVQIHGRVIGKVIATRVVLGVAGYLEGDVLTEDMVLSGAFQGRAFAVNVTVAPSAHIRGRIFHHHASVAKEARIEGLMPWRPVNFFEALEDLPEE